MQQTKSIPAGSPPASLEAPDTGFGLVEMVVAMFLLALVAVSFLPLLVNSLQLSIRNATTSTATQVLNGELDALLATDATCAALVSFAAGSVQTTDQRGVAYESERDVTVNCTTVNVPSTVPVTLTVELENTTVPDLSITTTFLIEEK